MTRAPFLITSAVSYQLMTLILPISTEETALETKALSNSQACYGQALENIPTEYSQARVLRFKRRDHLFCEDGGFWRIQSGYIRTFTRGLDGECVPLGFWKTGDIIGQPLAQTYPYEAQCLSEVTAESLGCNYSFSKEAILAQSRQSSDLLKIVHCAQVEQRLRLLFVWLAQQLGEATPNGFCIQPKLTHQEIADSINSTRVTVTRSIRSLEREGQINWKARSQLVYHSAFGED